jgi:signal transduction histidine kinase
VTVHAAEPITVLADEQRLRHALDALVENALHATEAGGAVTIDARVRDGRAVLEVSDAGVGIGDADRERIFERFARGADAERRPGTGLGLPIVKAIAEAHGGSVSVASRPGAGTSFTLRLGAPQPAGRTAPSPRALQPLADGVS